MQISEEQVRSIVESVLQKLAQMGSAPSTPQKTEAPSEVTSMEGEGIHADINEAIRSARRAHEELVAQTLEKRKDMIAAIRETVRKNVELISRAAVEETGLGRVEDKIKKNLLVARATPGPEDIPPITYTGDYGLTLIERAPYGVIAAITPCTNPTETIICNGIGMIAGGNAVVFNAHPSAKAVSALMVKLMNEAILSVGGPRNLLNCIANPTQETAQTLMKHPDIDLLVVTGGGGVVKAAMNSGKKVIAAGPGNPPIVVDETADIEKAGRDIVSGASLDNNIICTCEKEIFVVESVADQLKAAMCSNGAYELTKKADIDRLTNLVLLERKDPPHESVVNKKYVGKNPSVILKDIDISIGDDVRLVLIEVDRNHPLVWTEQLMPVMPLVRVRDVDEGIDLALEAEHGYRHTASMYSRNIEKLSKMARLVNTSIFIKNGPNYAGLAFGGEGYTSFTIASPTGDGLTSTKSFTRWRRCTLVDYFRIV